LIRPNLPEDNGVNKLTEIGIIAVGGYNEMKNMTGIRIDNDIIVLDMGLQLDRVQIHEDVEIDKMHSMDLIKMGRSLMIQ